MQSVAAQGVPTIDGAALAQSRAKLAGLLQDLNVQRDRQTTETELDDVQKEQLETLAAMTAAMSGPGFNISSLETDAGNVYPVAPSGPMDARLFGEGRETVERMIVQVAQEFAGDAATAGLSPTQFRALFQALIKQESRFNITAQSPVGAYGLTQLMPGTASDMGVDRYVPIENLRGGARYISIQLRTFGNIPHALAAYNAGPGNVRKYGGIPPFKETQGYVVNITRFYNEYLSAVGGVDALGTLSAQDWTLAEYSNTADASSFYGANSDETIDEVVARLSSIIRQIDEQPNVKAAIELNTYARAEIARILVMRTRLMAANQVREAAQEQHLVADRLAEYEFKRMEVAE
ncbi:MULTISPECIES: lytic transglycosylase domain-containing protein [Phaeobacter]|uniref:lytic transglycosylase domain-containing protein n=1 Tax=Phaeobacter TaxID=302485 RepID=UPI001FD3B850|nr:MULTISPECIES: lytic transglycosylase domain-containing protein [Phaeobacter]